MLFSLIPEYVHEQGLEERAEMTIQQYTHFLISCTIAKFARQIRQILCRSLKKVENTSWNMCVCIYSKLYSLNNTNSCSRVHISYLEEHQEVEGVN